MTEQPQAQPASTGSMPGKGIRDRLAQEFKGWISIRKPAPSWQVLLLGILCVLCCLFLWWLVTQGPAEERLISPVMLPSPGETFASFKLLWFDRALTRNTLITLERVVIGFFLAVVVGVPLGILAGCFPRVQAFLAPLIIFGRNIPLAALIALTFFLFGIGETQKVMFIFIACVAFITADAAQAVRDVGQEYIDTAYTLGAKRRQVILKVLVPLALPSVFNSLRLLFGLAFGYIMLAELIKFGNEAGGLGHLIITSQRRGPREHIYLIVLIIPVIALVIDRILLWAQRQLFPHRYGGAGTLHRGGRYLAHWWEDFKLLFWQPAPAKAKTRKSDEPKSGGSDE